MNKTPVSMLQELMVKKKLIVDYELILDGGGTHDNTFIYRVSCDGLVAIGQGRSKKDAKHEAAKAMLETIAAHRAFPQLPASPAQSPAKVPLSITVPVCPKIPTNGPFVNAIGALKTLCCDNNLAEPEYRQISDIGPPHERIFTIQCIVATFKEEAAGTTKKQAKHEAARKMLERIQGVFDNLEYEHVVSMQLQSEDRLRQQNLDDEIINTRAELVKAQRRINFGLKISEYHTAFKTAFPEDALTEIVQKLHSLVAKYNETPNSLDTTVIAELKEIFEPFDLSISVAPIKSSTADISIVAMRLDTTPPVVSVASGNIKENVIHEVTLKLIDRVLSFLE